MPSAWIVAKVCHAEDLLRQAQSELAEAQHDIARATENPLDGSVPAAYDEIAALGKAVGELQDRVPAAVRHVAELIHVPGESSGD